MAFLGELFSGLVWRSVAAGAILLAVILLRAVFRRTPRWIVCLAWGLAALRLLLPFSPESRFSLLPEDLAAHETSFANDRDPAPDPAAPAGKTPAAPPAPDSAAGESVAGPADAPAAEPTFPGLAGKTPDQGTSADPAPADLARLLPAWTRTDPDPALTAGQIFACLWLCGMSAMLAYAGVSLCILRKKVATATRLEGNIRQSEIIRFPFVLGLVRPKIYLPYSVDPADLPYVIAHEKAHIRRRDPLWKALGFGILALHFFNPLLWVAYRLFCKDIEAACDEKVIAGMEKEGRRAYSTALLHCSVRRRAIAACPLAFGEVGVKNRVKSVMRYKKPAFLGVLAAVCAFAAAGLCLLTSPLQRKMPDPFGHEYAVAGTPYSSDPTLPSSALSRFSATKDREMLVWSGKTWKNHGRMRPVTLDRGNFDRYFAPDGARRIGGEALARSLRRNCENVYAVDASDGAAPDFYYLLQQKNGDLYLTHVFYTKVDDMLITRLFQLVENDGATAPTPEKETSLPPPLKMGEYLVRDCLYLSPINQTVPEGGGVKRKYILEKDSFTTLRRTDPLLPGELNLPEKSKSFAVEETLKNIVWQWREFPYTSAEWVSFYKPASSGAVYNMAAWHPFVQALCARKMLMTVGDDLWLVEMAENDTMGVFLWSIYALEYASSAASLELEAPVGEGVDGAVFFTSEDALPLTGGCEHGQLGALPGDGEGEMEISSDLSLTVPEYGEEELGLIYDIWEYATPHAGVCWIPFDKEGNRVYKDKINLVYRLTDGEEAGKTYHATLYVTSEQCGGVLVYTFTAYNVYYSEEVTPTAGPDGGVKLVLADRSGSYRENGWRDYDAG